MCRDRITKEKMTTRRQRQRLEPCTYKLLDKPRITCKHQEQEEARLDSPLQFSEGAWSCQHLDFCNTRLAASRTIRQVNFCYFKPLNLRDFVTTSLGNYYTRLHLPSIFTDSGPGIYQNRVLMFVFSHQAISRSLFIFNSACNSCSINAYLIE